MNFRARVRTKQCRGPRRLRRIPRLVRQWGGMIDRHLLDLSPIIFFLFMSTVDAFFAELDSGVHSPSLKTHPLRPRMVEHSVT